MLDSSNIHLSTDNRTLSAKLQSLTQDNQNLLDQINSLQEKNRELDAQNNSLAAGTLALTAKVAHLDEENIQLRDIGRHDWEKLLKLLQEKFPAFL